MRQVGKASSVAVRYERSRKMNLLLFSSCFKISKKKNFIVKNIYFIMEYFLEYLEKRKGKIRFRYHMKNGKMFLATTSKNLGKWPWKLLMEVWHEIFCRECVKSAMLSCRESVWSLKHAQFSCRGSVWSWILCLIKLEKFSCKEIVLEIARLRR